MQLRNSIPCKFVTKKNSINDLNTKEIINSGKDVERAAKCSAQVLWGLELGVWAPGEAQASGRNVIVWGGTSVGFVYRWEPKLCYLTSFHFFIYFCQGPAWLETCSAVLGEFSAEANNCSVSRAWISSPGVLSTTGISPGYSFRAWALPLGKIVLMLRALQKDMDQLWL